MTAAARHVRFDWGHAGAARVGPDDGILVVVDVLSFTTAVSVAVERGVAVHPAVPGDPDVDRLIGETGAELAVGRDATTADRPWSLSPAALRSAPAPTRLVLPSPSGSAIAARAQARVVAACLRNAAAVAAWLTEQREPVTVIAAGERWPDGTLRPALEDLLGAGAVLAALARDGWALSPEADGAQAAHDGVRSVPDAVRACASGVELVDAGFGSDVEVAVEAGASAVVPVLGGGAFRSAA